MLEIVSAKRRATTFFDYGVRKIQALCKDSPFEAERILSLFKDLIVPWGNSSISELPLYPSDVSDDHTPFEFSLAIGGKEPELRILLEAQESSPSVIGNWNAGKEMNERLKKEYNVDLTRFYLIEDLFSPTDPSSLFSIWHAVSFWPNKPPKFKIYLNLQAQGKEKAAAILEEAFSRLGLSKAYYAFAKTAGSRGPYLDELKYFSLDLFSEKEARVKVYVRHHQAGVKEIQHVLSNTETASSTLLEEFFAKLLMSQGPFCEKPFITCLAFTEQSAETPFSGTLYAPIASYVKDDNVAYQRITAYLNHLGLSSEGYRKTIPEFAERPLEAGVRLHSYISLKQKKENPKVTLYLSPEAYKVYPPNSLEHTSTSVTERKVEEIVSRYETLSIGEHPLFKRLYREPVSLEKLWIIMANGKEGIAKNFPDWLSTLLARVENGPIRSILCKQLNDELGDGDFSQAHKLLYDHLLQAMEPFRPQQKEEAFYLSPGQKLQQRLAALYTEKHPYEGIGATIVIEIYGKQADQALGKEFRRQKQLSKESFTWVTIHEELEEDHADESLLIAKLVPAQQKELAIKGAEELALLGWQYLDDLYRVCFS